MLRQIVNRSEIIIMLRAVSHTNAAAENAANKTAAFVKRRGVAGAQEWSASEPPSAVRCALGERLINGGCTRSGEAVVHLGVHDLLDELTDDIVVAVGRQLELRDGP